MKKNLSIPKVHSLYNSLAREAWEFWGRHDSAPKLFIKGIYHSFLFGDTDEYFPGAQPSGSIASTEFESWDAETADCILLNQFYLPYMYEDEVIVALLHELAHAHAGLAAQHGPIWQRAAEEIGSMPEHFMVTRAHWAGTIPWLTKEQISGIWSKFDSPSLGLI